MGVYELSEFLRLLPRYLKDEKKKDQYNKIQQDLSKRKYFREYTLKKKNVRAFFVSIL